MSPEEFETMLKAENFQPPVTVQRAVGYAWGEHVHDFDACALVTAGEITLVVEGVSTRYGAGDIFRVPAGTPHLESAGPQGVSYLAGRRPGSAT